MRAFYRPSHRPRSSRIAVILLGAGLVVACSDATAPEQKPTEAQIRIEGTAPAPLRLVVSTDFFEVIDQGSGQPAQVFRSADTTFIGVPYSGTVPIGDIGSIVVSLTNADATPAEVRMRVDLDSGQPGYDQTATMSEGGTLRYVFRYFGFR